MLPEKSARKSLLYDTHVHTAEVSPCGKVPAREMVRLYRKAGYDGIVITDHFTSRLSRDRPGMSWSGVVDDFLEGYRLAESEGRKVGLNVLWAIELTPDQGPTGDFLVYGLDEDFLRGTPQLISAGMYGFRDLVDGREALVYQAHPFREGHTLAPVELLDGIEVINSNPRHTHDNEKAAHTATANGLAALAGSDAHRPEDVGGAGILLPRDPVSIGDFVSLLKDRKAEITSLR
jgi:predicted metal-dependent phosphoesterase TrpH